MTRTFWILGTILAVSMTSAAWPADETEDCSTKLARVDSKLTSFAPDYLGAALQAKTMRDSGAGHCQGGETEQALADLSAAESLLDQLQQGG